MAVGKLAKLGAAAVTVGAMVAGVTAPAASADVDFGAVTTGPLFALAQALGVTTITIQDVDVIGDIFIHTQWAPPLPACSPTTSTPSPSEDSVRSSGRSNANPAARWGLRFSVDPDPSAYEAGVAYEALLSSAAGNTLPGYTPLEASGKVNSVTGAPCTTGPSCIQGTNVTNLAVLEVNDPGTPTVASWPDSLRSSICSGSRPSACSPGTSASSTGIALNAATIGLALGYNMTSDFPATLNPFSLLNSVVATVLPDQHPRRVDSGRRLGGPAVRPTGAAGYLERIEHLLQHTRRR